MTYVWSALTSEAITNLFLYGQVTKPEHLLSEELLRPLNDHLPIEVDAISYMTTGPGRFIDPRNFAPIGKFFSQSGYNELEFWFDTHPGVTSKTFSLAELASELSWNINTVAGIQQSDYATTFVDEVYRAYVWGSSAFELAHPENLEFVVQIDNGILALHVDGIQIVPRDDDFDFQSGSPIAGATGQVSQSVVDPSAIGRTVDIHYENVEQLPVLDGWTPAAPLPTPNAYSLAVKSAIFDLEKSLFDDATRFLDAQDRPILYGTVGNDEISGSFAEHHARMLYRYKDNGVVLIGGDGKDKLVGGAHADELRGGEGDDTIVMYSLDDEGDTIYGGAGNDTFILGSLSSAPGQQEFVIEDADTSDKLMIALSLFNPELGEWQASPLFQLVGGIKTWVNEAYVSSFEWIRSTDIIESGPETWDGNHYIDASTGAIPFYGMIDYERQDSDLVIHLYQGGIFEDETTQRDGSETRIERYTGIEYYETTETVIRIKNFSDGVLGITYERDPGYSVESRDATIDEITSGLVTNGITFNSTWPPHWATEPDDWLSLQPYTRPFLKYTFDYLKPFADAFITLWNLKNVIEKVLTDTGSRIMPVDDEAQGSDGSDSITGSNNAEQLNGALGDDLISGGGGADEIDGGEGSDFVDFSWSDAARTISLGEGNQAGAASDGATLISIENVLGTEYGDTITGNSDSNTLLGGDGADTLAGLAGDDLLIGGVGDDYLSGGSGADQYLYAVGHGNDIILDDGPALDLDTADLTGFDANDLTFSRDGTDLLVSLASGGQIRVVDQFDHKGLEAIILADGVILSKAQFQSMTGAWTNSGPSLDIPLSNVSILEDSVVDFALPDDAFIDDDDAILQLTADLANGDPLPGWLKFNSTTQRFSGILPDNYSGTLNVRLTATDGISSVSDTFALTIEGENDAPTGILLSGTTVAEFASNGTVVATLSAIDPDSGDTFTYSIEDDADGRFTIVNGNQLTVADGVLLDYEQNLSHSITIRVTDQNGGTTARNFTVAVTNIDPENVTGTGGYDTIVGGTLDDMLDGAGGDDILSGGGGDDVLIGGAGADTLDGGSGEDTASYAGAMTLVLDRLNASNSTGDAAGDTFVSIEKFILTSGADTFVGSGAWETIYGGSGNDTLNAGAGNDKIIGGAGGDQIIGGSGTDTASYETSSSVTLNLVTPGSSTGDAAGDTFSSIEWYELSAGNDTFLGSNSINRVIAGAGNDTITGGAANDILIGGAGADALNGGDGEDTVSYAGAAALVLDRVTSGNSTGDAAGDTFNSIEQFILTSGNDTFVGSGQWETVDGGDGNDILNAGGGNDKIIGGAGADQFIGGSGTDTASYETSTSITLDLSTPANSTGDANGDTFDSIEWFELSGGNDVFVGSSAVNRVKGGDGDDTITGGSADDTFIGGAGADAMDGSGGYDTAAYDNAAAGIILDINAPQNGSADALGDTFTNIEKFRLTDFNDTFYGGSAGESIQAAGGNDHIEGRGGNDDLYGQGGDDTFIFNPSFGKDKIYDFNTQSGEHDVIQFNSTIFASYTAIQSAMTQSGTDVIITVDSNNSVTIKNVTPTTLTSDYFAIA